MAEEAESDGAPEAVPTPAGKRKLFLILGAVVGIVLLGGGGWFYKQHKGKGEATQKQVVQQEPFFVDIPIIVSNLDNAAGHPVFVKITAKLQVQGARLTQVLDQMPQIQDIFQSYLHETTQADLSGNGIYRLREALLGRIAVQLAPIDVRDLLFIEFLVQ